jgi:hypothetical protein
MAFLATIIDLHRCFVPLALRRSLIPLPLMSRFGAPSANKQHIVLIR